MIFLIFIVLFILSLLVLDIIVNFKNLKRDRCVLWKEDGYLFRFEMYFLYIPCGIIIISVEIIARILNDFLLFSTKGIVSSLLASFEYNLIFVCQSIFILLVTIYKYIRSCREPKVAIDVLLFTLNDKDLYPLLLEFSNTEFSSENLLAFEDIEKYERNPSLELAQEIFLVYLNGKSSSREINIDKKACDNIKSMIDKFQNDSSVDIKLLFAAAKSAIIINISDTYTRFIFYPKYVSYMETKKFKQNAF